MEQCLSLRDQVMYCYNNNSLVKQVAIELDAAIPEQDSAGELL